MSFTRAVPGTIFAISFLLALSGAGSSIAHAQDLSAYDIATANDIFLRETYKALSTVPVDVMPSLDCAVEYVRRFGGTEITYRRGPIPLHQANPLAFASEMPDGGSEPFSESDLRKKFFFGGLLVDLPRAGETAGHISASGEEKKYMIRVSIAPLSYRGRAMHARVLLERAVVSVSGTTLTILQNEVFSRLVDINGNEPLHFALPVWEQLKNASDDIVPASLDEALVISLETPRYFGFSRNVPEPFSSRTRLAYAVPGASMITLSIQVQGTERVLDQGRREAGVYTLPWDASSIPDGKYKATLVAEDTSGTPMYSGTLDLTKDKNADNYAPPRLALSPASQGSIAVSTESGLAYQFPADQKKSLRHMFTHIAVRVGYRISSVFEIGLLGGQDSFHETPGPQVDIDRINEYGGVVAYTYGYIGPYLRLTLGSGTLQPIMHLSAAFSNVSTITEIGAGVRLMLFRNVGLYIVPSAVSHLKSEISTKVGVHYGVGVVF